MSDQRPNVLLITSDQQHYSLLGRVNPKIQTPNLDRLAERGVLFRRAYCPNPTCTPSRASIITGKYPSQHGAWTLGTKLPESEHVIGDDFAAAGYHTALIGKAHLQQRDTVEGYESIESAPHLFDYDWWKSFHGPFYGFQHIELHRWHADERPASAHYGAWIEEREPGAAEKYFCNEKSKRGSGFANASEWDIPPELHYNSWIVERSNALLDRYKQNDENFFLWASFPDPHGPYRAPAPWSTMYDPADMDTLSVAPGEHDRNPDFFRKTLEENPDFSAWKETGHGIHGMGKHKLDPENYAQRLAVMFGMMSYTDHAIGRILERLEENGLADNTIVVFTTDHGDPLGRHGLTKKGPFLYDDLLRIPMIVSCPGIIPKNKTDDSLQSLVDFAPTILTACGIDVPRTMTGVNQWDVWRGKTDSARDHVLAEHHHEPTTVHIRAYINDRYKIIVYYNQTYGNIYDLKEDPGEINNLWDDPECQDLKRDLLLNLIHAELGREPMWMPRVTGA